MKQLSKEMIHVTVHSSKSCSVHQILLKLLLEQI